MGGKWQISIGDFSETLRVAYFLFAAVTSAWVLDDNRHRRSSSFATFVWTFFSFLIPPVVLPIYLITRIYSRVNGLNISTTPKGNAESADTSSSDAAVHDDASAPFALRQRENPDSDDIEMTEAKPGKTAVETGALRRHALAVFYLLAIVSFSALYLYQDHTTFDAHFARARRAQLYSKHDRAVREYRAALRKRDDAHTHKLLGFELASSGRWEDALSEFRAALRGGEPDDYLVFFEARALHSLGRSDEAREAYRRFLESGPCHGHEPDSLCDEAKTRANSEAKAP